MKQNKAFITIALIAVLSFAKAGAAVYTENPAAVPVELKCVGNIESLPLMQLDFSGTKEENEFSITITDENGFLLYSANVRGEKFSKQFLLNTDDLGDAVLNFKIRGKRSGKTIVYKVSPGPRANGQVTVVKL